MKPDDQAQGLKPSYLLQFPGTAEAVPFHGCAEPHAQKFVLIRAFFLP